jgi:hypothetical protein
MRRVPLTRARHMGIKLRPPACLASSFQSRRHHAAHAAGSRARPQRRAPPLPASEARDLEGEAAGWGRTCRSRWSLQSGARQSRRSASSAWLRPCSARSSFRRFFIWAGASSASPPTIQLGQPGWREHLGEDESDPSHRKVDAGRAAASRRSKQVAPRQRDHHCRCGGQHGGEQPTLIGHGR